MTIAAIVILSSIMGGLTSAFVIVCFIMYLERRS